MHACQHDVTRRQSSNIYSGACNGRTCCVEMQFSPEQLLVLQCVSDQSRKRQAPTLTASKARWTTRACGGSGCCRDPVYAVYQPCCEICGKSTVLLATAAVHGRSLVRRGKVTEPFSFSAQGTQKSTREISM